MLKCIKESLNLQKITPKKLSNANKRIEKNDGHWLICIESEREKAMQLWDQNKKQINVNNKYHARPKANAQTPLNGLTNRDENVDVKHWFVFKSSEIWRQFPIELHFL